MKTKISRIVGVGVTLSLLASLLIGALPASANVSSATVTLSTTDAVNNPAYVISKLNDYTITFDVTTTVPAATGWIDIQFPLGTQLPPTQPAVGCWVLGDVSVQSTAGFGVPNLETNIAILDLTTTAGTTTTRPNVRIAFANTAGFVDIGEAASVRVKFKNLVVTNAPNLGDQTILVDTSALADATPVASQIFTLVAPTIPGVPGVVQGYNSASIKIFEQTGVDVISAAINFPNVTTVIVGPGTYDETNANFTVNGIITIPAGITVTSSAGAATTLITNANGDGFGGSVVINGATTVFDGFTVTGGVTVNIGGATVQNCVLSNATGAALNVATAATAAISIGNSISAVAGQSGLLVALNQVATSTGDIFNTAATGTAITNTGTLTLSGATITGASGTGVTAAATSTTTTITGSSFSNLNIAVNAAGGATTISTSTIDACGFASATVPTGAVQIVGGTVRATANTISNGPNAIARVGAGGSGNGSFFKFNTFTANVASFANAIAGSLDATNNWWGSSAGPTVASTAAPAVLVTPWLIAAVTNPVVATTPAAAVVALNGGTATLPSAAGVNVAMGGVAGTAVNIIAAANYATSPVTAAPPADTKKFYDVYIQGVFGAGETATVTFFGISSAFARVYAYSGTQDVWVLLPVQVVDMFQGAVVATISATTSPSLANMSGLEFVITEPSIAPMGAPGQGTLIPTVAAEDVRTTLTSFTWGAVAGAASYDFELAPYLADSSDPFIPALTLLSVSVDTNGIILLNQVLDYEETYAWRVRAVRGVGDVGAWVTSFFTTAAEPEPDEGPPTWIIEQEPTQIEWPDDITIVIPPIEKTEIPEYILWVIVAVGAILVIAVVVLIVRTRRVA